MLVQENKQFNGIEVIFEEKPSRETLDTLKANGFRWHRQRKLWYAKDTEERRVMLDNLAIGKIEPKTVAPKIKEKKNIYGVKVGDIFTYSFGYDATFYEHLQVRELIGEKCVMVCRVHLPCEEVATSALSWKRICRPLKDGELLEPQGDLEKHVVKMGAYRNIPCISVGRGYYTAFLDDLSNGKTYEEDNYH